MESIRETFLPDDGCIFVRVDLSQAEDRLAKMYCGTDRLVRLANLRPEVYDAHTANASMIFKRDIRKESKEDFKKFRYLGKKVVHGAWREVGPDKMSESVSKDTDGEIYISPRECSQLLVSYHEAMPEVKGIYFPWVREQLIRHKRLVNSFGRVFDVSEQRIDSDLFRKAYSFPPQSDCADIMNQFGVIPGHYYMMGYYGKPLNMQVHDEVIASVPLEGAYDFSKFIVGCLEIPVEVPKGSGKWLVIPAEVKIGKTWAGGIEFTTLPEREEFYRKVGEFLKEA